MATCSFAGFLFGPRVLRSADTVAATPPPGVTTALLQLTLDLLGGWLPAAARAAAISAELKRCEVLVGFFAVGISARDQMSSVITARSPNQEDNSALPHAQALEAQFTVAFAIVFHRDHRVVEDGFQASKIYLVLPEILPSLRLVPSDHRSDCICILKLSQPNRRCKVASLGTECWGGPARVLNRSRRPTA
jgi:hypothetical protein